MIESAWAPAIALFVLIVYLVWRALQGLFGGHGKVSAKGRQICPNCGTRGEPKTRTKGSTLLEVFLWLMLIVPGLIYSLWRITSRERVCPACGSPMIPVDTPRGQQLIKTGSTTR